MVQNCNFYFIYIKKNSHIFFYIFGIFIILHTIVYFKKTNYTKTKKMMFYCSNFNIFSFFCYIKNYLKKLHVFINVYDL